MNSSDDLEYYKSRCTKLEAALSVAATDLRQWRRTAIALNSGECTLPLSKGGIVETDGVLEDIKTTLIK